MLFALLLTACKGGNNDEVVTDDDCYLTIYVYSPGNPIVTRSDVQYQAATTDELAIHRLQLWVFRHDNSQLVGYLEEANVDLTSGKTFRMLVTPEFADAPVNVDVYAMANVSTGNTGNNFSRTTTRAELDAATMQGSAFFGTSPSDLEQAVPADGLPMTGILTDQPVAGQYPALRVGTNDKMATVQLARCVSKVNFLIVRAHDDADPEVQLRTINSISLNGEMIPQQEYLMLTEPHDNSLNPVGRLSASRIHIGSAYETSIANFGAPAVADIPIVNNPEADPRDWVYAEDGVTAPLSFGLTYLRESGRQLKGTVTYTVNKAPDEVRSATFEMNSEGDFTRNHTWTVLIVFVGGKVRLINIVDIGVTEWQDGGSKDHEVYNW